MLLVRHVFRVMRQCIKGITASILAVFVLACPLSLVSGEKPGTVASNLGVEEQEIVESCVFVRWISSAIQQCLRRKGRRCLGAFEANERLPTSHI